ncbi:MAG: penicillin-binding protein 1A [Alphaproteobacteria bacterium]|jgi:penicillin-binding protein 1A
MHHQRDETMRFLTVTIASLLLAALVGVLGVFGMFYYFGRGLPDYQQLANYEPPVMTRVHAGDGSLITEYATEKRVFVPIGAMPKLVIKAFLAAEDKNFYSHPGVDFLGIVRAVVNNVINYASGRRPVGASTITQQVAKNFLLTNEVSIERKAKEAILAFRIEHAFTKDRILELYMNEIYLGFGSYGVAAAALNYFNKPLDELSIAEAAFLAALPKAPSNYHPVRNHGAAKGRRNWVIERMLEEGFISRAQAMAAKSVSLVVREREDTLLTRAEYFAEEVRRELSERYGQNQLYRGGLSVRTTLEPALQSIADQVLRDGLIAYDRRHGWRGAYARIEGDSTTPAPGADWARRLALVPPPKGSAQWRQAVVLTVSEQQAVLGFSDASRGRIPLADLKWARTALKKGSKYTNHLGPRVKSVAQVLAPGDVITVEQVVTDKGKGNKSAKAHYSLRQIPRVDGGLVALDPHTGRVLAMSGGYSFAASQFNRATQAYRQPGSAFKPFVYLAGLDSGFTPSSRILDAPFVIDQGPGLGLWKPQNYAARFYGPSTMRLGIEKSRNLMTVRLAQTIGMEKVVAYAKKFGIADKMKPTLAMALGAGETTLLRLTTAYAMLVNGGKQIEPSLIDRIQDRHGRTILRHDERKCPGCAVTPASVDAALTMPVIPDNRAQVADTRSAYQIVSMLQGVVLRGTGRRIKAVGKPLAGKTGTTNDSFDTWFMGFAPDLAVGVFIGFDKPASLGRGETGSSVAAPVFKAFMERALKGHPAIPFRTPPGIRQVRVNPESGLLAQSGERRTILEAFKPGTEPKGDEGIIDGSELLGRDSKGSVVTRGLY